MSVNASYVVKVADAKMSDIQKALDQAGIKVRSIVEVHKEEVAPAEK
jgi:hypothetical protein